MKAFFIGAIVGAGACYAIIQLVEPAIERQIAYLPSALSKAGQSNSAAPTCSAASAPSASDPRTDINEGHAIDKHQPPAHPQQRDVAGTLAGPPTARHVSAEQLSESEARAVCTSWHDLRAQSEREKKEAEPKDAAWAYGMEQLIEQHVRSRMTSEQYSNLKVECRTTFCELTLEGPNTEHRDFAATVVNEIHQQPWSDIFEKAQSSSSKGGGWQMRFEWYRPRDSHEREAYSRWRDRR